MAGATSQARRASWIFRTVVLLALLAAAPSLAADTLPISGPYGDAEGCRLHKGEIGEGDSLLLLTPDSLRSYATYCDILQVLPAKGGSFLVTGICSFEGEDGLGAVMAAVISKSPEDPSTLVIHDQDGARWGEVKACP